MCQPSPAQPSPAQPSPAQPSPAQPSTGRTVLGILADCDVRAERDDRGEPNEAETGRDTRQQLWRKEQCGVC